MYTDIGLIDLMFQSLVLDYLSMVKILAFLYFEICGVIANDVTGGDV